MMQGAGFFGGCLKAAAIAALVAVSASAVGPALAQSSIKIVVDDTAITTMDIQSRSRLLQVANRMNAGAAQKAAIDELIDDTLRIKDAQRRGITITDAAVDQSLAAIAARSNMNASQFAAALGQAGVPISTLKARLKAQMGWSQIVRARLRSEVRAGQDDLIAQMRRQEKGASEVTAEDFVLQRVVFTLPASPSAADVQRRRGEAEQLRGRFTDCEAGLALARGLREVAVINVGRRLAAEVTPQMYEVIKDVPAGSLSKPEVSAQGIEMLAVCQRIAVTGEGAASSAGIDADALDEQGQKISDELTRELRQRANIVYR
ncbi:MAG TPA: SurA N-terminal domain-containing protein [Methylomirabilota bacterium]|nr:SurA N-terminal domain-containing protein [Methylomirabilota bacterium]